MNEAAQRRLFRQRIFTKLNLVYAFCDYGESRVNDELGHPAGEEARSDEVERLRGMIRALEDRVQQLDRLAHQDSLIDLPNRRGFMRQLERFIDRVRRYGDQAAMLFVDIDGLKTINDTFGHGAGDEALIRVAKLLAAGVRKSDFVARLGGDEFGILLERSSEEMAVETSERLARRISACEFSYDGQMLRLGVAIGVGLIHAEDTAASIMTRADKAMYEAKSAA